MSDLEIKLSRAFLSETIKEFKEEIENARKHLKDEEFSLKQRWELYLLIRPYLKTDSCYWNSQVLDSDHEVSWYDDFYLEQGETQELDDDFVERALEKFSSIKEEDLKEEILEYAHKEGYGAFENDW